MMRRMNGSRRFKHGLTIGLLLMPVVLATGAVFAVATAKQQNKLKKVRINGVEIHYIDQGEGDPVIFVHGALADSRMWYAQVAAFSPHYRVIAYSRRYNFPNDNPKILPDHSAIAEAEDLAALITRLKLGPVHVVGASYGAYTALFLAVQHPELVRSLVLAEPPVLRWLEDMPGGPPVLDEFLSNLWEPAGDAFRANDDEGALRLSFDYFVAPGAWDQVPDEVRNIVRANAREWRALTTSSDAFPTLSRDAASHLMHPVLMLTGGQTLPVHHYVNDELERLVPNGQRVPFPDASHEIWDEFPELARQTTLAFLAEH